MANYTFQCSLCSSTKTFNLSISKFLEKKKKNYFKNIKCNKCNNNTSFVQMFSGPSSTIKRDREELVRDIQADARRVAQKIRSGDQKAIRNIYGED